MQLRNDYQKTLEKKKNKGSLLIGPGNYLADLGPHSEGPGSRKRVSTGAWVFFVVVKGGGLGFCGLFIGEFKT